jgi:hypothetical protein
MAGTGSYGQKTTPNPNVFAPAGMGGDVWGANGGGAVAAGGGATDQTGYAKPIAITPSDCEMVLNYIPAVPPTVAALTVMGQEANGLLSNQTPQSSLVSGGSNAG